MSLLQIFTILVIHGLCDFVLQTDEQAKGKSTSIHMLLEHTSVYSIAFTFLLMLLRPFDIFQIAPYYTMFFLITFISHTITDYVTSKINSRLWKQGRAHDFFVSIEIDQLLHYLQLFLTISFLCSLTK